MTQYRDATAWFEDIYAAAAEGRGAIPWASWAPNPHLVRWAERHRLAGAGRRALVVGCGLGDDAEYVAGLGFNTVAFDVAPTAIRSARERFPDTSVGYVQADLFDAPPEWRHAFDLVVESATVQALPEPVRRDATVHIGRMLAEDGTLVVIARGRTDDDAGPVEGPPWPLTRVEIDAFEVASLRPVGVEYFPDADGTPRGRWVAEFVRDDG